MTKTTTAKKKTTAKTAKTAKKATRAPAKKRVARAARPKKPLPAAPSVGMLVKLGPLDQRVITGVDTPDGKAPYRIRYIKCVNGVMRRGTMDWQAVLAKSGATVEEHWA